MVLLIIEQDNASIANWYGGVLIRRYMWVQFPLLAPSRNSVKCTLPSSGKSLGITTMFLVQFIAGTSRGTL